MYIMGDRSIVSECPEATIGHVLQGWCCPNPLSTSYLLLYSLTDSKAAKVAEVWEALEEEGCWNSRYVRYFNTNKFLLSIAQQNGIS